MSHFFFRLSGTLLMLIWLTGAFYRPLYADNLILKANENYWLVDPARLQWIVSYDKYFFGGLEAIPTPAFLMGQEESLPFAEKQVSEGLDAYAIKAYLERRISPSIDRPKQDVSMDLNEAGEVVFEGFAMEGRVLDTEQAIRLMQMAFKLKPDEVHLPVRHLPPVIEIKSEALKQKGILQLLAAGETDFKGSPVNRINNIEVGLKRFNGQMIAPQTEFAVGKALGPVDETTGYKKELVIKGDKTIPEYGGGLCQVSTTIYRGVLWSGLPVLERQNHSYAVRYYDPQGLDATIYPPTVDLKFFNNTPGHILLQTMTTPEGKAYVNYYGTKDDRQVHLIGPSYYKYIDAPPPKTEYTTKLPPGKQEKLGEEHRGFQASWFLQVSSPANPALDLKEHIFSNYEARALYYMVGLDEEQREAVTPRP